MLARALATILLTTLALVAGSGLAAAIAPDGPRLAVAKVKVGPGPATSELATYGLAGGGYQRVLSVSSRRGVRLVGPPAWSPDGTLLAFSHRQGGHRVISIVPAGGGTPRVVPSTQGGFLPVFSPDGGSLAISRWRRERRAGRPPYDRYESTSVWIVDLATGERRQLTRWREDLDHVASSFSPDGSTLLVTRYDVERSGESELVALRFDGRTSGLLVGEGILPVYSPDGSKIALFRGDEQRVKLDPPRKGWWRVKENFELYVIDADGSHLRRLTHTPHKDELFASWDPSGERIAYAQFRRGRFESPNSIGQINADGTCRTRVLRARRTVFYGAAWQPGPGREAGRISC